MRSICVYVYVYVYALYTWYLTCWYHGSIFGGEREIKTRSLISSRSMGMMPISSVSKQILRDRKIRSSAHCVADRSLSSALHA
jgi:hypothetical protein